MGVDGLSFFVGFPIFLVYLALVGFVEFPLICVIFLIVVFLDEDLFRALMTVFLSVNTIYLFVFNCYLLINGSLIGYEKFVLIGIAVSFSLIWGSLIRMRTFGNRRYYWLLMIAELVLTYYPSYEIYSLSLSV